MENFDDSDDKGKGLCLVPDLFQADSLQATYLIGGVEIKKMKFFM